MHERMLDKNSKPDEKQIQEYLGSISYGCLTAIEQYLHSHYQLVKEIRFPFGSSYGWGYKYSHKSNHLCYAFFENGAFTVTIQISEKQAPLAEDILPALLPKTQELCLAENMAVEFIIEHQPMNNYPIFSNCLL